ncbi:hypothetical protein D3C71_1835770 [compost metagenome]
MVTDLVIETQSRGRHRLSDHLMLDGVLLVFWCSLAGNARALRLLVNGVPAISVAVTEQRIGVIALVGE